MPEVAAVRRAAASPPSLILAGLEGLLVLAKHAVLSAILDGLRDAVGDSPMLTLVGLILGCRG
jgi:hypothetical protein